MNQERTGWPPGLLQDDSRPLSRWFASRPDARYVIRKLFGNQQVDVVSRRTMALTKKSESIHKWMQHLVYLT
jgi:hypothetical protein